MKSPKKRCQFACIICEVLVEEKAVHIAMSNYQTMLKFAMISCEGIVQEEKRLVIHKKWTISWLRDVSGPIVQHNCHGISISMHPLLVNCYIALFNRKKTVNIKMFASCQATPCVEMDIPWQLCRTIGPLLSQRFPLASAKAQPMGGFSSTSNYSILPLK